MHALKEERDCSWKYFEMALDCNTLGRAELGSIEVWGEQKSFMVVGCKIPRVLCSI